MTTRKELSDLFYIFIDTWAESPGSVEAKAGKSVPVDSIAKYLLDREQG